MFSIRLSEAKENRKLAKDLIYLVISDFFKDEGPYTVENKETFVFFFTDLKR